MAPDGDKIRVTARISKELDTKVHRYYTNVAPAIIEALELLVSIREDGKSPDWRQTATGGTGDLLALVGDKDKQIEFLKEQLTIKDSQLERQSYSLQSLIQVNSALNMKILPEKNPIYTEEFQPVTKESEITTLDSVILSEESEQSIETDKAENTEFSEMMSKDAKVAVTAPLAAKEIEVEEEPAQPMTEVPRHVPVQKTQKKVKAKPEREVVCGQCGKIFLASSEKAKCCSGKCRTAYNREKKKLQS
jgi:hypothetical protein